MRGSSSAALVVGNLWRRISQHSNEVHRIFTAITVALVLFLALYNLAGYPLTWFDEGSHLHVPKTLVRFGEYADYSSEGFRYYGPTIGVGPTVMLPIAGAFRLFGIGLLQARLVMALYLLATVFLCYRLARQLGSARFAWVAIALLVSSRGTGLLLYGRQVLGEVPGLFFLFAGLTLWFSGWEKSRWWRLVAVGGLFGLAAITKYQYLLFIAPTLLVSWLANSSFYRTAPQRVFLIPGIVTASSFAVWQLFLIFYLGPTTAADNLVALTAQSGGAALALSPSLMASSLKNLIGISAFVGGLVPAVAYGALLGVSKRRDAQQWGILWMLAASNLGWYVTASIGWMRYAFLGLAISSLFVARFFDDLTGGFRVGVVRQQTERTPRLAALVHSKPLQFAMLGWLFAIIVVPTAQNMVDVAFPVYNAPVAMAAFLDQSVPENALIETWEPEMGFLTDHNYHFPPAALLDVAVSQEFLRGTPVAEAYNFVADQRPEYVLLGRFSRAVRLYPETELLKDYALVAEIGDYQLYQLNDHVTVSQ